MYKMRHHEIRRFNNINEQTCRKCGKTIGLTYHCNKCKKNFAYKDKDIKKMNVKNPKITDLKIPFLDFSVPECPFCHSEDIHYVIPKKSSPKKR